MTGLPILHSHNEIRDAINGKLVYYIQICTYIVHSNIYIYICMVCVYIYIYIYIDIDIDIDCRIYR